MAKQTVNLGVIPNGVGGDDVRTGFTKVNGNFTELYTPPTQVEAETGTSQVVKGWTAQRVRQSGVATVKSMTVQSTGQSTEKVMSQKAVTEAISAASDWDKSYTIALRSEAEAKLKRNSVVYLDFANGEYLINSEYSGKEPKALQQAIDYTAPDGISVQTPDGRIVTAPADTPAIEWREGECQGLQVAPASTNLVWPSEQFSTSDTLWSYFGQGNAVATVVADESPTQSGFSTEINKSAADDSRLGVSVGVGGSSVGDVTTVSCYVRAGTSSVARIHWVNWDGGGSKSVIFEFDMSTGQFTLSPASAIKLYAEKINSKWWRIGVTSDVEDAANITYRIDISPGAYETGTIYCDGAQIEKGYLTPYIKTESSQVTRGSVGGDITTSIRSDNFTAFFELPRKTEEKNDSRFFGLSFDKSSSTYLSFAESIGVGSRLRVFGTGVGTPLNGLTDFSGTSKCALVVANGVAKWFVNGILSGTTTASPSDDYYKHGYLGMQFNGSIRWNGSIARSVLSNYAMNDAEAIALTTLEDE